jgi:hypothetical protein
MSIAGNCAKHGVPNIEQEVGRGKWVPVCPECEHERKVALAKAFWAVGTTPSLYAFHAACGAYHAEGSCPCGSPKEGTNLDIDGGHNPQLG